MARPTLEPEHEAHEPELNTEPDTEPDTDQPEPRPRHSLANYGDEFTLEYLQTAFQADPKQLFDQIDSALHRLSDVEEQVKTLEAEALSQRQDAAEILIQNDDLRTELLNALRQNPQRPSYDRPQKSTKLPDPPVFTDGKSMQFSDWLSRIQNKLRVNVDHYPTDGIQLAYVEGRVEGEAARHISTRLSPDSTDPYNTVQDLFDHLSAIYEDPNRVFEAKNEFKKLYMSKGQTFHEFHTKFLQLSNEAKITKEDLKYELNSKLSFTLQKAVISHFNSDLSFQEFAKQCGIYDQSLRAIEAREARTRRTLNPANTTTTPQTTTPANPTPLTPNPRLRPTYDNELRQQLSRAGKCFICQEPGHLMAACPKRRAELKAIEEGPAENEKP
jgi:hypothetical protein